jgi:uncharacterized protein (TIGR03643 family)
MQDTDTYCFYSDLPSPLAYEPPEPQSGSVAGRAKRSFTHLEISRIIEMAWEDRTPFEAIRHQFGLSESEVKALMKKHLRFSSYKRWRMRVERTLTKHASKRVPDIQRFRANAQRAITFNQISKRKHI